MNAISSEIVAKTTQKNPNKQSFESNRRSGQTVDGEGGFGMHFACAMRPQGVKANTVRTYAMQIIRMHCYSVMGDFFNARITLPITLTAATLKLQWLLP